MSRWPEPVREPLPVGLLTEQDIRDALFLCVQHSREPEDPEFDMTTHGTLGAAQAALIECAETLERVRIDRELHGDLGYRGSEQFGMEYVAQKVARRVINELRKWLPEVTYG